jgi:predicted AlkP superfamily phosphohydrolase/phosphomutase
LGAESCKRVLMVGIDAAEITLIERWRDDGSLPNLKALCDRGRFGPLASTAEWLVGSPWATFYTARPPQEHGFNHYLMWRPETMTLERPSPTWLPLPRFWHELGQAGRRIVVVNVPLTYAPEPFPGIEISGWATHESLMAPASHPPEILDWLRRSVADPEPDQDTGHLLAADEPAAIRKRGIDATEAVVTASLALMRKQPWDLFLACFSAAHRAGHALWDASSLADRSKLTDDQMAAVLKEVYVACDAGLGRLVAEAGADARVLVFAVHGMGVNTSRSSILPEMLARVLKADAGTDAGADAAEPRQSLLKQLRNRVPNEWRNRLKSRLPVALQDRLTAHWRTGTIDWSATRAFVPFCDLEGFVRVNLRGREAQGIIAPGEDYERLLTTIADGLRSFVDEDTGEPVVAAIGRRDELYPTGPQRDLLPDLIVRWSSRPAAAHRRLGSPRYGAFAWSTPGRVPDGRSGHHRPTGFLAAAGEGLAPGLRIEGHILDLAPTVFDLLGVPAPRAMPGRPLL